MARGPYKDRAEEYDRAIELRKSGYGYRSIADEVGVPWRTYVARSGIFP